LKKFLSKIFIAVFLALVLFLVTNFALPVMPALADNPSECWAVIIGVSNYQSIDDLNYADDDAQDLYQAFGPVWGADHITLLKDSQANKAAILSAIDWLADSADANDTVLFFFSGHGSDYGSGYFCPYDSLTYSWDNDISSSELASAFQPVQAEKIVIILDCCHAGAFQYYMSAYGRVVMMACRSYETSEEYWTLEHGVFTYYILEALNAFDDADINNDYELSAEEVAEYANPLAYWWDYSQDPIIDDYYFGELALLAKFIFTLNIDLPYGETILTLDGEDYTSAPSSILWTPGVSHTITVPQMIDQGTGTRYIFTQWDDGSVAIAKIIDKGSYTANYDMEHLLTVISAYGDPQGTGWYKDGSTAEFYLTGFVEEMDTRHIFTGWSGDYWGAETLAYLYMDSPKTVTADWRHEYLLTLNSEYGTLTGDGWYGEGETADFSVTPYIELADTKHIFTDWSGDYSGTSSYASLSMNEPKVVDADWRNEYLLTLNSEYGEPTGAGWYKEGETASLSVEPIQGVIVRHIFTGWSGDLTDTQADSSVAMDSPKVVTATWRTDFIQLYILIGGVVVLAGAITTTIILVRRHRQVV
jgi:hypothetical protein